MSSSQVWQTSQDGKISFVTLLPEHLQGALDVFNRGFIPYETVSIGLMVAGNEQGTADLDKICTLVSEEGVSIVALDVATNQVVGVAFNKIQYCTFFGQKANTWFRTTAFNKTPYPTTIHKQSDSTPSFLDSLRAECCNDPSTVGVLDYLENMDSRLDPFEHFGVSSLLDHMFLAVLPEFRGRKIAHGLVSSSELMANALASGQLQSSNTNGRNVGLVWAIFTSRISQHIGRALGWEELLTVGHDEFTFAGKKFSERIGPEHPDNILMAKRVKC